MGLGKAAGKLIQRWTASLDAGLRESNTRGVLGGGASTSGSVTGGQSLASLDTSPDEETPVDPVLERLLCRVRSEEVRDFVLAAPQSHYTAEREVKLLALTYNVNGQKPDPDASLDGWLDPGEGEAAADVIAVGFQELVPLHAANVLTGGEDPVAASAWVSLILDKLNGHTKKGDTPSEPRYFLLAERQMVGVYLTVWVHSRLIPHVRGVQITSLATGFGGLLGNKGAVAVRMRLFDTGLCWVCVHLTSGEGQTSFDRRIYDMLDIVRRLEFPPEAPRSAAQLQGASSLVAGQATTGDWGPEGWLLAPCHQHIIFMGDLNFRCMTSREEALSLIQKGKLKELLKLDGLRRAKATDVALAAWQEGPIFFNPTFKFRIGTNEYSGTSSAVGVIKPEEEVDGGDSSEEGSRKEEKLRIPSWTDRVLWRSVGGIRQLAYTSGPLTMSDHRPVAAAFLLSARQYDAVAVEALVDEGWRRLDMAEMAAMPRCSLEPKVVDFGDLEFGLCETRRIFLSNTGSTPAHFRFVETPGLLVDSSPGSLSSITPSWLQVDPLEGVVEAGATADIVLTACVAGGPWGCAHKVAAPPTNGHLDLILVLHIAGGSDFFVSLAGHYVPSCFGRPLAQIAPHPDPESAVLLDEDRQIPQPLARLLRFIEDDERIATPGLLSTTERKDEEDSEAEELRSQIRRALSSGSDLPGATSVHDAVDALAEMFRQLPHPLMPQAVVQICEMCVPTVDAAAKLLKQSMGEVEFNTFNRVTIFVLRALEPKAASTNGLTRGVAACYLADLWFPHASTHLGLFGTGADMASDLMRSAQDAQDSVKHNREEFVKLFL